MTAVTSDSMSVKNSAYPQLKGFHHIEIYVGNAGQAAHFYRTLLGFEPVAYAGLETGERDHVSYVMKQGDIRLVLTAALSADSPVAEHVHLHGDSVKDIAFQVDDAALAFETAVKRGAGPLMEPKVFESETGRVTMSKISSFGHTVHSFIEGDGCEDTFSPNYRPVAKYLPASSLGFTEIDHIAISVEEGKLDQWIDFYKETLGFHQSHEEDIYTEHSAMNSKVVEDSSGVIKFPMMEPAPSKRKSQIGEFLDFHRGAGAQHIALLSDNLVSTVRTLEANNIEFLRTPETYYKMLKQRVGEIGEDIDVLRELNILVDRDEWGYLFQIFTKPLQSRPTLFLEAIQRMGARGFGSGNIKALFEALEREQATRGNL